MEKLKKIWNFIVAPMAFFLSAFYFLSGDSGLGCIFMLFGANEVFKAD